MRILLDTNVLISAYFWNGRERALLWDCIRGIHENVISDYIIGEVKKVLGDKFGLPDDAVERYVLLLATFSTSVPIGEVYHVSRDPKDNPIIATALSGKVDALITGDKDLLALRNEENVFCFSNHCFKILRPGEFK
ncbi:putative toxin-antitoxin system toxin component, PIN family [Thermococcus sp. MV11]|uniref:putative toxin-antitoxin system toxin component, PIN family n=1 Tax=Thermococcus sp. MV11 TaxID=1638267 RepID=UPI001431CC24|nr:putative toxin-antitoxin system toxin component, PIN family [Thermococcus sp. MV11]NJE03163.1 putative toxin-antitoxin system toxin component, PIN family [Thermococcus sp. MV11]